MVRRTISDYLGEDANNAPKAQGRALVPTGAPAAPAIPGPSGAAPPDGTPASSDALAAELSDLTRTLDLLSQVVASVSDRLDDQGAALDGLGQGAAEHRAMTSSLVGAFSNAVAPAMERLSEQVADVARQERDARARTDELLELARHARLEGAQAEAAARRRRLAAAASALLALLLAALVGLALPRYLAASSAGCWLVGGTWNRSDAGATACVFWAP